MRRMWLLAAIALVTACGDDPVGQDGGAVQETDLTFIRFSPEAEIADMSGSFWAVRGENTRIRLDYEPLPGELEGETFLEFEVRNESLLRRPNGELFQEGDSVLITVTVDDARRFLFTFSPSGLQFDPEEPAELRVRYAEADPDFDDDGDVDGDDAAVELNLALWKQDSAGDPWVRVGTAEIDEDLDDVRADIDDFTSFSLASN